MRSGVKVAAGLLLVAGIAVAGSLITRWQQGRLVECEQRAARLEGMAVLSIWPDILVASESYAGCDVDRVVAYAGRQYHGKMEQESVVEFYRRAVEQGGWQLAARVPPPGDHTPLLCATTDIDGAKAYLSLSIAVAGTFQVHISDVLDAGHRCVG